MGSPKCALDEHGCLSLRDILASFNAPINEQHTWALCYQCAKCFRQCLREAQDTCHAVSEFGHVRIHQDGHVHPSTVLDTTQGCTRMPVTSEFKMVFDLGMVLFQALDYGLADDEEPNLSPDLERLLNLMTPVSAAQETDDEGIERDSGECDDDPSSHQAANLDVVIEQCGLHLGAPCPQQAETHYKAVCRALVAEALEFSTFLEKVSQGTQELRQRAEADAATSSELDTLRFQDWARLWVQVIHELRHGVKLKKVGPRRPPIEFELTPYEILMDDIRSRRYKLKQVMVDGELPHRIKRDAHAVILEFIRSRPPLKKASERKLAPLLRAESTPRELLMESIKKAARLKPSSKKLSSVVEASPLSVDKPPSSNTKSFTQQRRLIAVDFSKLQMDDDDDDDEEEDEEESRVAGPVEGVGVGVGDEESSSGRSGRPVAVPAMAPWQRTAYDLATAVPTVRRQGSVRRAPLLSAARTSTEGCHSVPHSRPLSPSLLEDNSEAHTPASLGSASHELTWSRTSLQDEFLQSKNWQQAMECLSLTLEEIVHIRSVLTKAELESLPVDGHVKEDVEKGKVCFLCLKTRFGIFGPWKQICKLCKRAVCTKCYSKMRIPTEHFARVPVFALSPNLSSPEDDAVSVHSTPAPSRSMARNFVSRLLVPSGDQGQSINSVGSAPSSPRMGRAGSLETNGTNGGPQSLPTYSPASTPIRGRLTRATTTAGSRGYPTGTAASSPARSPTPRGHTVKDHLRGLQMIVCNDCKAMVLQIIKSSRTSRSQALRHLTLNLSPVY